MFDELNELGRGILWQWLKENTDLPDMQELFHDVYATESDSEAKFAAGCLLANADSRRDDFNEAVETVTRLLYSTPRSNAEKTDIPSNDPTLRAAADELCEGLPRNDADDGGTIAVPGKTLAKRIVVTGECYDDDGRRAIVSAMFSGRASSLVVHGHRVCRVWY